MLVSPCKSPHSNAPHMTGTLLGLCMALTSPTSKPHEKHIIMHGTGLAGDWSRKPGSWEQKPLKLEEKADQRRSGPSPRLHSARKGKPCFGVLFHRAKEESLWFRCGGEGLRKSISTWIFRMRLNESRCSNGFFGSTCARRRSTR